MRISLSFPDVTPELQVQTSIAEKVEQLGLEFRKMHDHTYDDAMNMAGKTNCMAALVQDSSVKSGVDSNTLNTLNVCIASFFNLFPKWHGNLQSRKQ